MNLGTNGNNRIVLLAILKSIVEKFSSYSDEKIAIELIEIVKKIRIHSVFLISYDFKNNNSKIKTFLLSAPDSKFQDSVNGEKLPETTLVWIGSNTSTIQDASNNFKEKVKEVIRSGDLDTDFSKTIVVEVIEQKAAVEDKKN